MEIKLALLADYANVSREGKLNIMGVFGNILAPNVPAMHPQMQLVIMIEADSSEADKEHMLEIQLVDMDGKNLFSVNGVLKFKKPPSGQKVSINHNFQINGLTFERFGEYAFKILTNRELKKTVTLSVVQSQDKA